MSFEEDAYPSDRPKVDFSDPAAMKRLRADLRDMARKLEKDEVASLVETYYMLQRDRIRINNRIKALTRGVSDDQPPLTLSLFHDEFVNLEALMIAPIKAFVEEQRVGRWLMSNKGIGPILAACFLSQFDVSKTKSAGGFIRFAGLDPTLEWKKGQKRPFNAMLKKTCFLIGESFVKVSNRDGAYYGEVYRTHKESELAKNESGALAPAAARYLANIARLKIEVEDEDVAEGGIAAGEPTDEAAAKKKKAWTKILTTGKLPPFLIDKRARRKAVALFVNHTYEVMYEDHFGNKPAWQPYVIDIMGHKDYLPPPNWPAV